MEHSSIFISDCILRKFENVDSIYAYLPICGISLESLEKCLTGQDENGMRNLLKVIYFAMQSNMQENVSMAHAGNMFDVSKAYFHEKFGWTVESEIGKAYLGKIALSPSVKVNIGLMSYISGSSTVRGTHKLEVGSFCSLASGLYITTTNYSHPTDYPSTFNFRSNERIVSENMGFDISFAPTKEVKNGVVIGNDVWVGRDVTIMNGVTLGDGCVVGTKALVTENCEPYGIYGGVPAKLIRFRFQENMVSQLLKLKWWQWPYERISRNKHFFNTNLTSYKGSLEDIVEL